MGARQEAKQARREHILDTAERLIRRDGAVSFSMRELASEAELANATPFNLFGSKWSLLSCLLERELELQRTWLRDPVHAPSEPIERVLALAHKTVGLYVDESSYYRPLVLAFLQSGKGPRVPMLRKATDVWRDALADADRQGLLRPEVDALLLARQFHLLFRAGLEMWVHHDIDDRTWVLQLEYGALLLLAGAVRSDSVREDLVQRLARNHDQLQELGSAAG